MGVIFIKIEYFKLNKTIDKIQIHLKNPKITDFRLLKLLYFTFARISENLLVSINNESFGAPNNISNYACKKYVLEEVEKIGKAELSRERSLKEMR